LNFQEIVKISSFGLDLNDSKTMAGRGGYMPGGGRPRKADEERVRDLSVKAIVSHYGSEEAGFTALLTSKEPALIKFVFEHAYGKPREKMDIDLDGALKGGPAVIIQAPDGVTVNLPENTEEAENLPDDGGTDTAV
jgi:hypothetical protein